MRRFIALLSAFVTIALVLFLLAPSGDPATSNVIPPPIADIAQKNDQSQVAVLAGGCFWGIQGVFEHVKGVSKVVAGYSGGEKATATYAQVSTETTDHAESVQITFNPREVSFGTLLRVFFSVAHDPTQLNRQGPDVGPSYRSVIFAANQEQKSVADAYIQQLMRAKIFQSPVVTQIEVGKIFYPAEDYHQNYLAKHPTQPYIVAYDLPKIAALKKLYPNLYCD